MSENNRGDKPSSPADLKSFIVMELEKCLFLITGQLTSGQSIEAFNTLYYLFPNLPPDVLEKPVIIRREREANLILEKVFKTKGIDDFTAERNRRMVIINQKYWVRDVIRDIQHELYDYLRTGYRGIDLNDSLKDDEEDDGDKKEE